MGTGVSACGGPRSAPLRSTESALRLSRPCRAMIADALQLFGLLAAASAAGPR